jgi:hypothetical protein
VKCEQSLSTKYYEIYNSEANQLISDTNSTTDTYYYILVNSGKYLRWDGNRDTNFYGLYFDSVLKYDYQKDWYLFSLEVNDNRVRIKNAITNSYLVCLPSNELILANLKDNNFESEIHILNMTDNWFNIRTNKGLFMTKTIIDPFEVSKQIDIYSVGATDSLNKSAELIFIKAENISKPNIKYVEVLGTHLNVKDYYCIKIVDKKNENKYLNWDTNIYSYFFGLSLDSVSDNECPDREEFWFRVEVDVNETYVRIKNKKSMGYISYYEKGQSFLLSDLRSVADPKLNLILSSDQRIIIKTNSRYSNHTNYLSDKSWSKYSMRIFVNEAVEHLNESARFVFVKKDIVTKSDAHVIYYCFYNKLFISFFVLVFANILYK